MIDCIGFLTSYQMDDPKKQEYLKRNWHEYSMLSERERGSYKRTCRQCQKEFYAGYPYAKWCSYRCTNDSYIQRRKERNEKSRHRVCLECKQEFIGTRKDAKY